MTEGFQAATGVPGGDGSTVLRPFSKASVSPDTRHPERGRPMGHEPRRGGQMAKDMRGAGDPQRASGSAGSISTGGPESDECVECCSPQDWDSCCGAEASTGPANQRDRAVCVCG
jgi:hypothetical protein